MTISEVKNIGDSPRYKLQSPVNDLNIVPIKFELTAGVITNWSGVPASLALVMDDTSTLRILWPKNLGGKAHSVYLYLVGEGDPKLVKDVDKALAPEGSMEVTITTGFTGSVEGYVALSSGDIQRGRFGGPCGDANRATNERRLSCARSPVKDLLINALVFTMDDLDASEFRQGPLEYEIEPRAGTGAYVLSASWNVPHQDRWVMAGTTDLGNVVLLSPHATPGLYVMTVRTPAGAPIDLLDEEQVRLLMMGPFGDAGDYHERTLAELGMQAAGSVGVYPACSLVRDPVFIPVSIRTLAGGVFVEGGGSALPQGVGIERLGATQVYRFYNGSVPARAPGLSTISPWVCADHLLSPGAGPVVEDFSPLVAGQGLHEVDAASVSVAGENILMGYTLLSCNTNR